ncbi:MAG: hypothetical protein U9N50_10170 [Pseudomonadota bacterium]|nr:hypothetical protein [Pseudomonadota bacterium]
MKLSKKNPLKCQLQRQFSQVQLSDSQFETLEDLMNQGSANVETPAGRRLWGSLAVAAMFVVAVVTTFMLSQFSGTSLENMPQLIAEEVVSNHLNMKPLEVKAGSINKVRGYFTKLNFMPADSQLAVLDSLQLLGGRYCSLQGITAAQLRMKQGENIQTQYQTEYLPEVFGELPHLENGEEPLIVYAKGIKVKVWVEKDLLFALTDSPAVKESME